MPNHRNQTRHKKAHRATVAGIASVAVVSLMVVVAGCTSPGSPGATQTQDLSRVYPTPTPLTGDELYEAAKQKFLEIRAERNKLEVQGGADELPESLKRHMTGDYEETTLAIAQHWKAGEFMRVSEPSPIVWIKPYDEVVEGSVVAINECTNGTSTKTRRKDGTITTGSIATTQIFFKYFDGELLAFTSTYEWVESC